MSKSVFIPSKPIIINSGEKCPGGIFELELTAGLRPDWLTPDETIPVYIASRLKDPHTTRKVLAFLSQGGKKYPAIVETDTNLEFTFDPRQTITAIQNESYFSPTRPIHTYFSLPYHLVPGYLRLLIFKVMSGSPQQKRTHNILFPSYPIDKSVSTLLYLCASLYGAPSKTLPDGKSFILCLSHDIDTHKGFENIKEVAALESQYGFTSCWFIVGRLYQTNFVVLDGLKAAGDELGLHGDTHDNRLAYLSREKIIQRLSACSGLIERFQIKGFRPPSLLESDCLRETVGNFFRYSSGIPDSEIGSLIAPRRGCGSVFPFIKQGLPELPLTLPLDDKLLITHSSDHDILEIYRRKIAWIKSVGGIAMITTHPEPHIWRRFKGIYERLLHELAQDESAWRVNPADVVQWWFGDKHGNR